MQLTAADEGSLNRAAGGLAHALHIRFPMTSVRFRAAFVSGLWTQTGERRDNFQMGSA